MDDLESLRQKIRGASESLAQLISAKSDVEKETLSLELSIESLNKEVQSLSSILQEDEELMLGTRVANVQMDGDVSQRKMELHNEEALNNSLFDSLNNESIAATALYQRIESQLDALRKRMIAYYPSDEARMALAQELETKRSQRATMALAKKDQIAAQRNYLQNLIEKRTTPH